MIDVVCALIENDAGALLACKRAAHHHLGGHWEFPGGKVEAAESASLALQREIQEELGVEIQVGQQLKAVEWTDGKVAIRLMPYCCRLISGEPHPHEHEDIRWCGLDELQKLDWAPADIPILHEWITARLKPE